MIKFEISKYDDYKDSGIEWLGDVPAHWNSELIKRSIRVLTDYTANGSFASLAENVTYQESGYARLVRLTDLRHDLKNDGLYVDKRAYEFLSKTKINGGELLIANVGAYTGLVKLVPQIDFKATLGPNMFLAIFNDKLLQRFINYQLSSICCFEQFRVQMTTTAQPKLNKDNFRSISIVIPPFFEQQSIADYLDTKTTQIDRKIDLLTQKATKYGKLKQSLINETVTRGLDKTVTMKESGVEWIGEVPEHWKVKRFKEIFTKTHTGWTPDTKQSSNFEGKNIWVTIRDMDKCYISNSANNISNEAVENSGIMITPKGSLLFSFKLSIGKIAFAACDLYTNEAIISVEEDKKINLKYFYYTLPILLILNAKENIYGAKLLNQSLIFNTSLLYIALEEQKAIADFLDTKTAHIDRIIESINTQIEKLKEFRKTLINDVVTGKIKVYKEVEII